MDIRSEILKEHSLGQSRKIAAWVGNNPERFANLFRHVIHADIKIAQRAAWCMSLCCNEFPKLVLPHVEELVKNLSHPVHVAVRRNTFRVLCFVEVPEFICGELLEHCFSVLEKSGEAIAVKVFAMQVAYNISLKYPDLQQELGQLIKSQLPYSSPGFRSRGNKILKLLNNKR